MTSCHVGLSSPDGGGSTEIHGRQQRFRASKRGERCRCHFPRCAFQRIDYHYNRLDNKQLYHNASRNECTYHPGKSTKIDCC